MKRKIPGRLYKYRDFSDRTLQMLIADKLFFADPSTFNDPLDAKPCLEADLDNSQLKDLLGNLVSQRREAELEAAAKSLKYKGDKTRAHIFRHSTSAANQAISEVLYHADNTEFDEPDVLQRLLVAEIERELLGRYDSGIFSLAENSECPLMWSHYGDEHKGICLGYSVPDFSADNVRKVEYGKSRLVKASDALRMLSDNALAKRNVDKGVLLRKSPSWRYEREWRLIGRRGLQNSCLELEEVIFGLRCSAAIMFAVVKALKDRSKAIKFYQIRERKPSFDLVKVEADLDGMFVHFPMRSLDIYEMFEDETA